MTTPDRVHRAILMRKQQDAMFLINELLHSHSGKADVDKALHDAALDLKRVLYLEEDEPVYIGV